LESLSREERRSKMEVYWDVVKEEMSKEKWEPDPWNDDIPCRRIFLGTVFDLTPSGKYYMPWACSNVEICDNCVKTEHAPCSEEYPCSGDKCCEVCQDARFWEELEAEAGEHGYAIASGEGDPCDIFIVEYKDKEAAA
jgi:hypothetical protein